jgi:hypothetical protein
MPRQPYLPAFAGKRYSIGFESLDKRADLAALIGRIIALWSWVDNEVAGLFRILLTTGSEAAHRVFGILRRWATQREILDAAADTKLTGDELHVYRALIIEYGSLERERNYLGDGCFGICPDDDDLPFAISLEHHMLWQADILPKHYRGEIPADSHAGLKKNLFVYRKADIERLHSEMQQLWWNLFYFNGYLRSPKDHARAAEFRRLFAARRIQERIAALKRSTTQNGPWRLR